MAKLVDLATQHPGGWQDIIDFVNAHYDRYNATYKKIDATVKVVPKYSMSGDASKADREYSSSEEIATLSRLENIEYPISGIASAMGWEVLKSLGLPIPGSKEWTKPCSQWRINEASK